jgi:hypothetical protein
VAATPIEVLTLDRETFSDIVTGSPPTAEDLTRLVYERLAMLP